MLINPVLLAMIGVGWLFIRYLVNRGSGDKEPTSGLWMAGLCGVLAVIIASVIETRFVWDEQAPFHQALLIGTIEECAKLLPLAFWLYRKSYFNEVTDGVIYFGIAGMVFGVIENIFYSLSYGDGTGIVRLLTIPFLHAGFCISFGWLLARHKVLKDSWLYVLAGLVTAIGLHTLYDFGLLYGSGFSVLLSLVITISVNLMVFYLYGRAEQRDRVLGLAASSRHNWYCPHCGTPNPERRLHCSACGQTT